MVEASVEHDQRVVDQFSRQAVYFAKLPAHEEATQLLLRMGEVGRVPTARAIDGHGARYRRVQKWRQTLHWPQPFSRNVIKPPNCAARD